ncbi:MAG: hypothetical protein H0X72_12475 [Acidobacteria bacterium]|jgi:histone H3/H4|nr:hypothetical protein [Acidobacteriota bacterium]
MIEQPSLFEAEPAAFDIERILLYALGEFQSRGKVLANRELALDRLRGAFKRATEKFEVEEFSDEKIANALEKLNAKVIKVPNFVAKHPFRVTIQEDLAEQAKQIYQDSLDNEGKHQKY